MAGKVQLAAFMGPGQEANGRLRRCCVKRDIYAHILTSIDTVVGEIMVPWRCCLGAGFLAEDMFVKKLGPGRPHKLCCQTGGR